MANLETLLLFQLPLLFRVRRGNLGWQASRPPDCVEVETETPRIANTNFQQAEFDEFLSVSVNCFRLSQIISDVQWHGFGTTFHLSC